MCSVRSKKANKKHITKESNEFPNNLTLITMAKWNSRSLLNLLRSSECVICTDTAPFQDLRDHHPKIFKLICMQLDHFNHWQELGKKIKIPDKKLQRIGTSSTCAKTVLEIIEKRNPNLTVQEMKLVLKDMSRKDVCDALDKCLPTGITSNRFRYAGNIRYLLT